MHRYRNPHMYRLFYHFFNRDLHKLTVTRHCDRYRNLHRYLHRNLNLHRCLAVTLNLTVAVTFILPYRLPLSYCRDSGRVVAVLGHSTAP
jgi:hypothetical protein